MIDTNKMKRCMTTEHRRELDRDHRQRGCNLDSDWDSEYSY